METLWEIEYITTNNMLTNMLIHPITVLEETNNNIKARDKDGRVFFGHKDQYYTTKLQAQEAVISILSNDYNCITEKITIFNKQRDIIKDILTTLKNLN